MRSKDLQERSKEVLKSIIQTYIATWEPVSSEKLAPKFGVSAATIRNIMAQLEDDGYLMQPHTSAGRLPTDKGYRFYVDSLLERHSLSPQELEQINRDLFAEESVDHLMRHASHLLSTITHNIGIVISPPISFITLKHIEFLKLDSGKILVIIVSQSGRVQNKVIKIEDRLSQDELNQASRYLLAKFYGKDLITIKNELLKMICEEKALYDTLLQRVMLLSSKSLWQEGEIDADVYVDGTSNLFNKPEFVNLEKLQELFKTFEEKSKLVRLILECIKGDDPGIRVVIGRENDLSEMQDCSLIAAPYSYDDRAIGSLGVLGPMRMEYAKAIPLVDYIAKMFGKALSRYAD